MERERGGAESRIDRLVEQEREREGAEREERGGG